MAFFQSLRSSLRILVRRPAFYLVVLATLAISIGSSVAMFSVVSSFLFSSLPYEDADRLVMIWRTHAETPTQKGDEALPLSPGDFTDLSEGARSFERVAGLNSEFVNVTGAGEPSRIHLMTVTGDFFGLMRTKAALGRTLGPQDAQPGAPPAVVVSHEYWREQLGGDPSAIGHKMEFGGGEYEIVGVLPASFHFVESLLPVDPRFSKPADVWSPLDMGAQARSRGFHVLVVVGRLKRGVGLAAAQDETRAYARHAEELYPETDKGYGMRTVSLRDQIFGPLRPALLTLWAATGFVVLIACANLAALLLARGMERHRELAVRFALGASRWRIVSDSLTESLSLSLAGGVIGLLVAYASTRLLTVASPLSVFRSYPVRTEPRVLWFALGVSVAAGLVFGFLPALWSSRVGASEGLREGNPSGTGRSRLAFLGLAIGEVTLATALLIGAGLSVKSFVGLLRTDLGVKTERLLTMDLFLPLSQYRDTAKKVELFRQLLEGIRRLPGVESVGMNYALPFGGSDPSNGFTIEGRSPLRPGEFQSANLGLVNAEYFQTLAIPLLRGRTFSEADREEAPLVAIVDERFAKEYFAQEDPLGRKISIASDDALTIVGIVKGVKQEAFEEKPRPYVYLPYQQRCYMFTTLAVKTRSKEPLRLVGAVRREIRKLDRNLPVSGVSTLDEAYRGAIAPQRYSMMLISLFAGVALVLTQIGIYGVMSFLTRHRRREVGIRLALGADPKQVFGLVIRQGLVLGLAGAALGLLIALALGRVLASLVYGIDTADTFVFSLVPVLILLASILACYRPARALSGVDPNEILRSS